MYVVFHVILNILCYTYTSICYRPPRVRKNLFQKMKYNLSVLSTKQCTYSDVLCEIGCSKDEPHPRRHSSSSPSDGGGSSVIAAQPCAFRSPHHHNILIRYLNIIIINNIHDDGATAMSAAVDCRSEWAMTYAAPRVF